MTAKAALNAPVVTIKVHPSDTLIFSFPIWLICHGAGVPVRLQAEPMTQVWPDRALRHEQPTSQISGIDVTHLLAILETIHERWPFGGVWPAERLSRARARDACAGIVELCTGVTPLLVSLPTVNVCADSDLSELVRSMILEEHNCGYVPRSSVTALAVLAQLLGVRGLLDAPSLRLVQMLMNCEAARAWFAHPSVQQRLPYYQCGLSSNRIP